MADGPTPEKVCALNDQIRRALDIKPGDLPERDAVEVAEGVADLNRSFAGGVVDGNGVLREVVFIEGVGE